jgi:hypothetical protein
MSRYYYDIDVVLESVRNSVGLTEFAISDEDWQTCADIHAELAELFSTLERRRVVRMNNVYSDQS